MIRIAHEFDDTTLRTALAGGPGHDRGRHRDRTRDDPHEIVYKRWLYFVRVRLIGITSPATAPPARPAEAQGLPQC